MSTSRFHSKEEMILNFGYGLFGIPVSDCVTWLFTTTECYFATPGVALALLLEDLDATDEGPFLGCELLLLLFIIIY